MPKKAQFKVEEIVQAALDRVRKTGWEGLTAPAVARDLGCSTMPIYSHFKNMEDLQDAVVVRGWDLLMEYECRTYTGDTWIDWSVGYVLFANKEKRLYLCMFDGRNLELHQEMVMRHWRTLTEQLEGYAPFEGLDDEQRLRIRYTRGVFSHGLASAVSLGFASLLGDEETITRYIAATSRALLKGFQEQEIEEGENGLSLMQNMKKLMEKSENDPVLSMFKI